MTGPAVVAILALDGVLVDLHLDARVRREIDAILAPAGIAIDGEDLVAGIESACAELGARDTTEAARLAARLWADL